MKKNFLLALIFISVHSFGQLPSGFTMIYRKDAYVRIGAASTSNGNAYLQTNPAASGFTGLYINATTGSRYGAIAIDYNGSRKVGIGYDGNDGFGGHTYWDLSAGEMFTFEDQSAARFQILGATNVNNSNGVTLTRIGIGAGTKVKVGGSGSGTVKLWDFYKTVYFGDTVFFADGAAKVSSSSSDSVFVRDASTGAVKLKAQNTINPQTLQQVFNTEDGGSVLTKDDSIQANGYRLNIYGSAPTPGIESVFNVDNSNGLGNAIQATSAGDAAVKGTSATTGIEGIGFIGVHGTGSSVGVQGNVDTDGIGVYGVGGGDNARPIVGQTTSSSENSIITIAELRRTTSGTTGNGIGGALVFKNKTTSGSINNGVCTSNSISSEWVDVTDATKTSLFKVGGVVDSVGDDILTIGDRINLTESSATTFISLTIQPGKIQGGYIYVTIEANDGTDYQARTLRFIWSAVNKAGTTTVNISTPEEVVAVSSGTLTATITAVDAGSGLVNFKANAVSSLTQTKLRATYHMGKNF